VLAFEASQEAELFDVVAGQVSKVITRFMPCGTGKR
jgi:hypothetical protein